MVILVTGGLVVLYFSIVGYRWLHVRLICLCTSGHVLVLQSLFCLVADHSSAMRLLFDDSRPSEPERSIKLREFP